MNASIDQNSDKTECRGTQKDQHTISKMTTPLKKATCQSKLKLGSLSKTQFKLTK